MGTGVASRFVAEISEQGIPPAGTILESPFNNIHDVVKNHPFSKPFRWLGPLFDKLIIDRWVQSGLVMRSDQSIGHFKSPILILHAADDHIIPIQLGKALAESAKKAKKDVKFVEFEANLNLRHKFIHRAPHFIEILTLVFHYKIIGNVMVLVSSLTIVKPPTDRSTDYRARKKCILINNATS